MSWFDTSGLASLAKTALKEAQKQIDKALDIQDEEIIETQHPDLISSSSSAKNSAKTVGKTTQLLPTSPTNEWDSFNDGTFFDNTKSNEMITTPPKSAQTSPISSPDDQFADLTKSSNKRESIQSNSDSIDLLSTPCSGLTSPSVDVITPSSVISPEVSSSSPNSVEIISPEEILLEDDDDSMSYNTVMDDNIVLVPESKLIEDNIKQCNFTDSTDSGQTLILSTKMQKSSSKSIISLNDSMSESQTVESFENVQMPVEEKLATQTQLVKISNTSGNIASESSGQLSDPPSADEIETTTSSDIEIISNPNGDSSSSNSRISPGKLKDLGKYMGVNSSGSVKQNTSKPKGHYRDNSEISIQSESENSQSEIEKLMRRISELNEVLEQRELRLLEVSRQNCSLTEKNNELQKLLDAKYCNESEENTQRLSALEKKFQSTLRERDALREQLNNIRSEFAAKIPKDDLTKIITEKDNMIVELRIEGEKLSKQILQHSNIIKKLRTKEKESDTTLKKNKEQIESLTEEVERLKKSLTAKDDVERSQIDAVHKLSSAKRKMEKENQSFKSQIEDMTSKLETLQTSFDAAKKELQEKEKNHLELSKKANAFATLETEKNNTQLQNLEIISQLEELREKLKVAENGSSQRENSLRQENNELLRRLQEAEIRSEELTNDVTMATVPLVRQLEDLRNTLITRTNLWEKQEDEFMRKLKETESNFEQMKNIETQSKDQQNLLKSKIKNLEDRLQSSLIKCEETNSSLQKNQFEFNMKEADYKSKLSDLENKLEIYHNNADELNQKCKLLEEKLEAEQKHYKSILEETATIKPDSSITERGETVHNRHSPTLSLGRNSMSESLNSSAWQMDDLDMISNPDRRAVDSALNSNSTSFIMANSQMGHSTAVLENLQSSLKQRDGEISQLQWELTRVTTERNILNTEVANLTLELENIKEKVSNFEIIEKDLTELKHQYDALLQMYGEKVEETQELELDLQDVKEMYKAQIDELLKQQKQFLLVK